MCVVRKTAQGNRYIKPNPDRMGGLIPDTVETTVSGIPSGPRVLFL